MHSGGAICKVVENRVLGLFKIKLLNETCFQEELSAKLLEYLESPHATTDIRLANKEQVYSL